jgi:hypothetical protein
MKVTHRVLAISRDADISRSLAAMLSISSATELKAAEK